MVRRRQTVGRRWRHHGFSSFSSSSSFFLSSSSFDFGNVAEPAVFRIIVCLVNFYRARRTLRFFFTRAITSLPRKVTPAILFPSSVSLVLPDNSTKVSSDRRGPRDIAILRLHGARDRPIRVTIIVVRFEAKLLAQSVSLSIQLEPLRIFSVSLFFCRNVLTKDSFTKVVTSFSKMSCSTASVLTIT